MEFISSAFHSDRLKVTLQDIGELLMKNEITEGALRVSLEKTPPPTEKSCGKTIETNDMKTCANCGQVLPTQSDEELLAWTIADIGFNNAMLRRNAIGEDYKYYLSHHQSQIIAQEILKHFVRRG